MKSKTSFFNPRGLYNGTLFRKNLTRYWPLWGLTSFCGGILPLAVILTVLRTGDTVSPVEFSSYYYNVLVYAAPPALLCYCILTAAAVWNWLYNPRAVGMMHTLPIRREGLFVTSFLSGLAMTAIPCAIMAVLAVILSLITGGFQLVPLLITILGVAADGFFYFSTATAAAMITGNAFALPLLYFLFHFLEVLLDFAISVFASNQIFGLNGSDYSGVLEFLSPTVYLMKHVTVGTHYAETARRNFDGSSYYVHNLDAVWLENGYLIAVYALLGAVLLIAAWAFYRLRRSECAGDVIAIGWGKPVFKAGITGLFALGGGQLLYAVLFYNLLDGGRFYALLPLIFCTTLAGLIGYYAASMLLAKTLRVFRGSLPGIVTTFVCCAVLCAVVNLDVFGIAKRIPADSQISYVQLDVAGNGYTLYPAGNTTDDSELLAGLRELHQTIIDHKNEILSFDYSDYHDYDTGEDFDETDYAYLRISYALKNGLQVNRTYSLNLVKSHLNDPDSWEHALDSYVNSPLLRNKRLHAGDPNFRVMGGNLYVETQGDGYELSSREAERFLTALSADADEGTWGTYYWFDDPGRLALNLNLQFEKVTADGPGRNWDYIEIRVRPEMRHTVKLLIDLGYVTDKDLITYDELNRQQKTGTWSNG